MGPPAFPWSLLTSACITTQSQPACGLSPSGPWAPPTLGRAGDGRGLFFTSIQFSESRSGRLADRPLGSVFRLLTSSVLVGTGVTARGEPGADSEGWKGEVLNLPVLLLMPALRRSAGWRTRTRGRCLHASSTYLSPSGNAGGAQTRGS